MQTPEFGDCVGADVGSPRGSTRRQRRESATQREFPPPISWLATTANLQSDVPWVMKKYFTSDGRLVIKEERVKHHDYFLANRSNGRLVLNLVHVDDVVEDCDDAAAEGEEETHLLTAGSPVEEVASECYTYNGIGMGLKPCGGFAAAAAAVVLRPPVHT